MRVGLYLRVSTGEQTVANQERELVEAIERHGWTIVATFRDEGISGSKGRDKRPGFDCLCKAITRRFPPTVFTYVLGSHEWLMWRSGDCMRTTRPPAR